jgi:hypothetical protein
MTLRQSEPLTLCNAGYVAVREYYDEVSESNSLDCQSHLLRMRRRF